jgi:sterol-4alpha-carboxylate 3-dehydrogenase (decarboxylating)
MATSQRDTFLVIGGSGFLGRHIVEALIARGDPVAVFDIVQRYHDTPFYSGDISDQAQVSDAIRKVPSSFTFHAFS